MIERITPNDVGMRLRKQGYKVPANTAAKIAKNMKLGRRLRSPHVGTVLTEKEAATLEAEIINNIEK